MEIHQLTKTLPSGELLTRTNRVIHFITPTQTYTASHIHDSFEIYIHVSGDISFIVEGNLYKMNPGDIIFTMPNEIHYHICNSPSNHEGYCLWFDGTGDYKVLFAKFKNRKKGENNKITLPQEIAEKFISKLDKLHNLKISEDPSALETGLIALELINIISENETSAKSEGIHPSKLIEIEKYIDENIKQCSIDSICKHFFVSRSSLGRLFQKELKTTPSKYIESIRLRNAKICLQNKLSVQEAFEQCGFPDCSHFISLFKKRFGLTPLQYKKNVNKGPRE